MANELKEVQRLKAIRKKDNVVATNGNIIDSLASNSPNDAPSIRVINDILKTKSNENHSHTKSQIGLENVDNTSDNNKPVSAIQREAIEESLSNANSYTDRTIDNLKKGVLKTLEEDVANLKTSKAEDNHTHSKADINDMPTKLSQFTNDKTYTTLAEVQNLVAALVDSAPSTLDTLKEVVVENKADIGIAYDGDSDRIGIIDAQGRFLTGDKLLLIYAMDLIEDCKKTGTCPTVVSEVKCSQVLYDTINKLGGNAVMCKTGHGYIKDKMKETNALLAGEMSGHTFFKDRYYGFDDAVYAGCRIIEIIAKHKKVNPDFTISDMLKPFDEVCSSSEVRFPCPNELKKETLEKVKKCVENNANLFGSEIKEIITLDGMRIVFDGGFALIRQSNTEPVFTLRFEAKNKEECERFKSCMINTLENILK